MSSNKSDSQALSRRRLLTAGAGVAASAPISTASAMIDAAAAAQESFQFRPGFDLNEALDLAKMCNYLETPGAPKPHNWDILFTCPDLPPFDEKWQLWRAKSKNGPYAIVVRGTVLTDVGSILEDLLAFLLKAEATIELGPLKYSYKFAAAPRAGVHLGFALGALMLAEHKFYGILAQLQELKVPAGSKIYVAGHSQGAAVTTLLRSYLNYSSSTLARKYAYKTYVFAQPKPGNDYFSVEFGNLFSNNGLAYRVTNSLDWVPQVPFTIELPKDLNVPNPLDPNALDPAILSQLQASKAQLRSLLETVYRKRAGKLKAKMLAVISNKVGDVSPYVPIIENIIRQLILESLNFSSAASEIALIGSPCQGPPGVCDSWYQHHLTTYEMLMRQQLRGLPHGCYSA